MTTKNSPRSKVWQLVSSGLTKNLKSLLKDGSVNWNELSEDGHSLFHVAVERGNMSVLAILLAAECPVDPNTRDSLGQTALLYAVRLGKTDVVYAMLQSVRVNPNIADNRGYTPLHAAVRQESLPLVDLLLQCSDLNMNARDVSGRTPLMIAVQYGFMTLFPVLSAHTALDPNIPDADGRSPLHHAVLRNHITVLRLLLQLKNIQVNQQDCDGRTPLFLACLQGSADAVIALLDAAPWPGLDPNRTDAFSQTPLYAACCSGHVEVVRIMIQRLGHALDLNAKDQQGLSSVYAAVCTGNVELLDLLLSSDPSRLDCNVATRDGHTPLYTAACQNSVAIVDLLLEKGSSVFVNGANALGHTPLHAAADRDNVEIVSKLLSRPDCDPNAADMDGTTPLILACFKGHERCVKKLVEDPKVKADISNRHGVSAMSVAIDQGLTNIVHILSQRLGQQQFDGAPSSSSSSSGARRGSIPPFIPTLELRNINLPSADAPAGSASSSATGSAIANQAKVSQRKRILPKSASSGPAAVVPESSPGIKRQDSFAPGFFPKYLPISSLPLHLAILQAHEKGLDVLKALLQSASDKRIDVNARDEQGRSALHLGVERNCAPAVGELLKLGLQQLEVNGLDTRGLSPLALAIATGATADICTALIRHPRLNINMQFKDHGNRTVLHMCIEKNREDVLRDILEYHPEIDVNSAFVVDDISHPLPRSMSALHLTVLHADVEMTRILCSAPGLSLSLRESWLKRTPLQCAICASKPSLDVIRLLLSRGASLLDQDAMGNTAGHLAVYRHQVQVLDAVLHAAADVGSLLRTPRSGGQTVLESILRLGNDAMIASLLQHLKSASVLRAQGSESRSLLHSCLSRPRQRARLSKMMLTTRVMRPFVKLDETCRSKWPWIFKACAYGDRSAMAHVLQSWPANKVSPLDVIDDLRIVTRKWSETVLHAMARGRHWDLMESAFLSETCSVFRCPDLLALTNSLGETVLHVAIRKGCPLNILYLLLDLMPSQSIAAAAKNGNTALHEAVRANVPTSVVRALLQAGCLSDTKNRLSLSPCAYAKSPEVYELLLTSSPKKAQLLVEGNRSSVVLTPHQIHVSSSSTTPVRDSRSDKPPFNITVPSN
eukprot:ANDGO_01608.mRNA.1 Alpha-latrotoxin-Lh1a